MKKNKHRHEVLKQLGLSMNKNGLYKGHLPDGKHLIKAFAVHPMCHSTTGGVLGVAIEYEGKTVLIPMDAIREPKKLATHLERVGLLAPTSKKDLGLLAQYLDQMARRGTAVAILSEGLHLISIRGEACFVGAWAGKLYGSPSRRVIPVLDAPSVCSVRGTLPEWNEAFAPLLQANPLMLFAVCFALGVPLATVLGVKPVGILFAGPSSTGKTTLTRLAISTFSVPDEPHKWAGTINGVEALAVRHRDLPLVIDELGSGSAAAALELIYRVSGGVSKARAKQDGSLQSSEALRSPILATGEVTLQQHAALAGLASKMGHEARMPTIQVKEKYGVFSDISDAASGAEFSANVLESMYAQHGTVMPAFMKAMLADTDDVQRRASKMRKKMEADIAGCDVTQLSGVEKRVLDGFLTYAIAGELAIRFNVLDLPRHAAKNAVGYVYKQWLPRWRDSANGGLDAPVVGIRNALKEVMNDFVPLTAWEQTGAKRTPGYNKSSSKHGELYLIHQSVFERMCGSHGIEDTVRALRHHQLLVTDKDARTKLFRMPGAANGEKGARMAFYAVRKDIIFDQ